MDDEVQIPAIIIPTLVKVAARMGLSVPRLLEISDLDESFLQVTDDVLPFSTMNRFISAMVELSDLPTIGLYIGSDLSFDYLRDLERFITTSSTAREAVRALVLFERFSPFYHFELREKENLGEAHLIINMCDQCPENLVSVYIEMFSAIINRFGKIILGDNYKLKKLVLGSRLNGPLFEYKKIFNAPIEAGATNNSLILPIDILDMPLVNALPEANEEAEQGLRRLIRGALNKHGYKAKVLALMRSDINFATGSVGGLAKHLEISIRGLQRKLKEEEATFSEIQLEARMEFAMEELGKSTMAIEQISEYLGFSNRRSFSRAFHQWYGTTPSNYRNMFHHGRVDSLIRS
jgi:AraC-like DNA-binding protein